MWPHSCVITTKYAACYTCLSPTTCSPVFSPQLSFSLRGTTEAIWWEQSHGGRCERGDPDVMDAGMLGDRRNKSHIWNSNQNARRGSGQWCLLWRHQPSKVRSSTDTRLSCNAYCKYLEGPGGFSGDGMSLHVFVCSHACVAPHSGTPLWLWFGDRMGKKKVLHHSLGY